MTLKTLEVCSTDREQLSVVMSFNEITKMLVVNRELQRHLFIYVRIKNLVQLSDEQRVFVVKSYFEKKIETDL